MDRMSDEITQPKTTDEFVRALYNRQSIVISEQKEIKQNISEQLLDIRSIHEKIIPAMCTRITKLEERDEAKTKESDSIKSLIRNSIVTVILSMLAFAFGYGKLYFMVTK